jgi:hypothetical protein
MPKKIVPWLAGLVLLLGLVMLILGVGGLGSTTYDILRWLHLLLGFALIGLFEAAFARAKRAGEIGTSEAQLGMVGRITMTLALLVGLLLLASLFFFSFITGTGFSTMVYVHAGLGIIGVLLAIYVFLPRRAGVRN